MMSLWNYSNDPAFGKSDLAEAIAWRRSKYTAQDKLGTL